MQNNQLGNTALATIDAALGYKAKWEEEHRDKKK